MKRYLSVLLVFVAALASVIGVAAGLASADVKADPAGLAAPATASANSAAADPRTFWTKERMAAAVPADLPEEAAESASVAQEVTASGPPVAHPGALPAGAAKPATLSPMAGGFEWPGPQDAAPAMTSGRIFWVTSGIPYSCSGSAVNSGNKDMVFTAGHCIHSGAGGSYFLSNSWVFAPDYRDENAPFWFWTPRKMQTTNGWAVSSDRRYDMGAVLVNTNFSGQHLVNVVGGQGFAWNQPSVQFMIGFGYPAVAPYDGERLIYCNGTTFLDNTKAAPKPIGLTCNMTQGQSGGPWLRAMNASTGLGWVNSVYAYTNSGQNYGPYFGAGAGTLFNANANA